MNKASDAKQGIRLMIEKHQKDFRCPENLNFYSPEDYKEAERKYIKFRLSGNSTS